MQRYLENRLTLVKQQGQKWNMPTKHQVSSCLATLKHSFLAPWDLPVSTKVDTGTLPVKTQLGVSRYFWVTTSALSQCNRNRRTCCLQDSATLYHQRRWSPSSRAHVRPAAALLHAPLQPDTSTSLHLGVCVTITATRLDNTPFPWVLGNTLCRCIALSSMF